MNSHISGSVVLFLSCGERALSVSHAMMTKREDDTGSESAKKGTAAARSSRPLRDVDGPYSEFAKDNTTCWVKLMTCSC